jgi:hypothetical protein
MMEMLLKETSITVVLLVTWVGTDVSEEYLQSVCSLWQLQLAGHGDAPASRARTMATIIRNSHFILLRIRNNLHVN